jgi:branched-chain amino acid transport system ATP-binding protein
LTSRLLTVKDLNVYYGAIHAIKGISFHINRGEIVSLIGANGAGKSTTLRAISGLVAAQGDIMLASRASQALSTAQTLDSTSSQFSNESAKLETSSEVSKTTDHRDSGSTDLVQVANLKPHEIARLGVAHAPEGRGIFLNLTVLENLELGAYTKKSAPDIKNDIEHGFELFPVLRERQQQMAETLSGGEQQMLAIARALMLRPQLLILDEPSLGLAPKIVTRIFDTIQTLNQKGMTILLVEQNARIALKCAHRAYVIETGKIALEGKASDLMHDQRLIDSYLGGH